MGLLEVSAHIVIYDPFMVYVRYINIHAGGWGCTLLPCVTSSHTRPGTVLGAWQITMPEVGGRRSSLCRGHDQSHYHLAI